MKISTLFSSVTLLLCVSFAPAQEKKPETPAPAAAAKPAVVAPTPPKPVTPTPPKPAAPPPAKPATPTPAPAPKVEVKPAPPKPAPPPPAPKPVALFTDPNLEAAVRKQVFAKRENKEPLTAEDVANVAVIDGKGLGIKNLSGLEKCVQLASITVPNNQITDIKALAGLARLQFLDLGQNQVADITPLATCKALQYLELTLKGCGVTDITPLEPLTDLQFLFLENNQITDLALLHRMWKKDNDGPREWAPYCQISVEGNPLTEPSKKLAEELKAAGARIKF
jgi:internalin A